MKNIIIIGARGYGREFYEGLKTYLQFGKEYVVKGFLDDKADAFCGFKGYAPILSSVENYEIKKSDIFICALGDVNAKEKYIEIIKNKGGSFLTLIHPTSIVFDKVELGEGVVIMPFCIISANVKIGKFSTIQPYSNIGHDSLIGDFCSIESFSFLGGFSQLGNYVTLHTRSTIMPHLKIGDNSIVGAGSVVLKNVKQNTTVFGVPAKKIEY